MSNPEIKNGRDRESVRHFNNPSAAGYLEGNDRGEWKWNYFLKGEKK
jgi:hypothetical protein